MFEEEILTFALPKNPTLEELLSLVFLSRGLAIFKLPFFLFCSLQRPLQETFRK